MGCSPYVTKEMRAKKSVGFHPIARGFFAAYPQAMKSHLYKIIELTGTSPDSIEDAVDKVVKRAHKTIKNLCWFEVLETRGRLDQGKVQEWQVTIKVGFALEG